MFHTEGELWRIVLDLVRDGVSSLGLIRVVQAYQGTTQSDGTLPRVVLHRLPSRRVGAQGKKHTWIKGENGEDGYMLETDTWRKEDTYQANALVDRAPNDEAFTAKDLLEVLGAYLQSQPALDTLKGHGMGILRVNDVTETPYENEKDNYRMSVSLKFTLTYTQTKERKIPVVTATEAVIHRV